MPIRMSLCALVLLTLAGCSQDQVLEKFANKDDQKVATACIDAMRAGKLDELEARLDPSLRTPATHETLLRMTQVMPPGKPDAIKLVGASFNTDNTGRTSNVTYQYTFGARNFLVNCATRTQGAASTIVGINVDTLKQSIEAMSKFDWKGKSPIHYAIAAAAVLFLLLSLLALIRCITDKELRRKWLWVIFILFGICQFSLDWSTGEWKFSPLYLLLFSASAVSSGYGPWEISVALPLGAIVYLTRRFLNSRSAARSNIA